MRVTDPRGRSVTWSFAACRVLGDETRPRSGLHKRAREVLRGLFPGGISFEEVPLPGTRLRFDFVVPSQRLAVEVQGEQHFAFNPYFHKSKAEWMRSLDRDRVKRGFCRENGISLACLKFSETDDEWRAAVQNAQAAG